MPQWKEYAPMVYGSMLKLVKKNFGFITLDTYIKNHNIKKVDFIKIDV